MKENIAPSFSFSFLFGAVLFSFKRLVMSQELRLTVKEIFTGALKEEKETIARYRETKKKA